MSPMSLNQVQIKINGLPGGCDLLKKCCTCKKALPLDSFYKNKAHKDGLQGDCKNCRKIQVANWKINNPDRVRTIKRESARRNTKRAKAYRLLTLYNLTYKEFESMLIEQDSKCAICEIYMDRPHVDHCHNTGKVRSLLCATCNQGIGMFKDNVDLLTKAQIYLKRWV
jgi:hypothetical protein